MLYDAMYYTLSSGAIILSAYGILYLYDPKLTRDITIHVSWESVNMYHKIKNKINKFLSEKEKIDKECKSNNEKCEDLFLGYNVNDDTTYKSTDLKANYLKEQEFDIMIIIQKDEEDKEYYKRLNDKTELENYNFDKGDKIFIQVEIEQNNTRISIQEHLEEFYLDNNKILDEKFLKWYLTYFYSMNLSNDYKLHIIDSDINIFTLNKNSYINLKKVGNKMKYEVVENK